MRFAALLLPLLMVGCKLVDGSSDVLSPERDAPRATAAATPDDGGADGFDLDSYKDEQAEADAAGLDTDSATLLDQLGAEGIEVPEDPLDVVPSTPELLPTAAGQTIPAVAATAAPAGTPRWTPADAVTLSWGLRLLSTVDAATPPRAILGLPDGSETVVKAGDLLADEGVIVLAVGQGVVQLGQVTAKGDHAQVESVFLRAMFPGEAGGG